MRILLLLLCVPVLLPAQAVLDNEFVRVLSVTSQPGRKSAMHQHQTNRVMIYLDEGAQTLAFQDGKEKKQTWKAGEVRWDTAGGMHTSLNTYSKPYRIVEIELKKAGGSLKDVALDPVKVDPKRYKVEFENPQVRVVRARYEPNARGVLHEHANPRVLTLLTSENMEVTTPDGAVRTLTGKAGDVAFGQGAKHTERNLNAGPFEIVVVELKQ